MLEDITSSKSGTGRFITFEGTEGGGKSTQIALASERLRQEGRVVRALREPGGTPIGEEIRHTLKHSANNHSMTPEAELLLMNASRAQLVREVIRPALAAGEVVLCDRFYHSTLVYQGYGRQLGVEMVNQVIEIAVGHTKPDLTLLLRVPLAVSEERQRMRNSTGPAVRDRFEEADRSFFARVDRGYDLIVASDPKRIRVIDATCSIQAVHQAIWTEISALLRAG